MVELVELLQGGVFTDFWSIILPPNMKPRADIFLSTIINKAGFTKNASEPPNSITSITSRIILAKSSMFQGKAYLRD